MTIDTTPPGIRPGLAKVPTGIPGLDEVTGGGLPRGRPTLVSGAAGAGKTLLGLEFLVHGALQHGENGVILTFEESADDLATNVASLGYDLDQLQADGSLLIDAVAVDPADLVETGAYDLDGLIIRLFSAIDAVGAQRVVLDTIEVLFSALHDATLVRAELARLFRRLKERGVTAVVTSERGQSTITRYGVEEYVSDCVILLDHRVHEQVSTRRLRVVKYRGSLHGTNEYPFLITDHGIVVFPITGVGLTAGAQTERMPTGVERLDRMLGGGPFRGSSVLVTGGPGTGKTTLCAAIVDAACRRGERCILISFEESPAQLTRNMRSVGVDLVQWGDAGLLTLGAHRPSSVGLEAHLTTVMEAVQDGDPAVVALDAVTALHHAGAAEEMTGMLTRVIDFLKGRGITTVLTALSRNSRADHRETTMVSSLMDTWVQLVSLEANGERNRVLKVRKARGTWHSNQAREFVLTEQGIELLDVPLGPDGALTGSARLAYEAEVRTAEAREVEEVALRKRQLANRTAEIEAQIAAARRGLDDEVREVEALNAALLRRHGQEHDDVSAMAEQRSADSAPSPTSPKEADDGR